MGCCLSQDDEVNEKLMDIANTELQDELILSKSDVVVTIPDFSIRYNKLKRLGEGNLAISIKLS